MTKTKKPKKAPKRTRAGNGMEERFVDEYMIDQNATQAAVRAGASLTSARTIGYRLLRKAHIATEISNRVAELAASKGLTAERLLQEYKLIALSNPMDFFRRDGSMKPLDEIPEDALRALGGLEVKELRMEGTEEVPLYASLKKVKLWDKLGALRDLAKIMGLLKEKVEVTGLDGLAEAIARGRKRAAE